MIEKTVVVRECNQFKSKTEQLDRDCQNTAAINLKLRSQTMQYKRDRERFTNEIESLQRQRELLEEQLYTNAGAQDVVDHLLQERSEMLRLLKQNPNYANQFEEDTQAKREQLQTQSRLKQQLKQAQEIKKIESRDRERVLLNGGQSARSLVGKEQRG